jgi:hypothetical protein
MFRSKFRMANDASDALLVIFNPGHARDHRLDIYGPIDFELELLDAASRRNYCASDGRPAQRKREWQ